MGLQSIILTFKKFNLTFTFSINDYEPADKQFASALRIAALSEKGLVGDGKCIPSGRDFIRGDWMFVFSLGTSRLVRIYPLPRQSGLQFSLALLQTVVVTFLRLR